MVLEDLIPVQLAEEKPLDVVPIAFIYSTLAIFLSLWIFPANAAIVAVFLTTIACLPLMLNIISFEKHKSDLSKNYLRDILFAFFIRNGQRSERVLSFFMFLFLGLALAVTFWFVVLPSEIIPNVFYLQLNTIKQINLSLSGGAIIRVYFTRILINNLKVLTFSVLFSLIYGAGAVFIIAWNASVIGVAMGSSIRRAVTEIVPTGFATVAGYSSAISVGLMRYLLHGVPEILAYFVGALAGSLISIAIVKREYDSEQFTRTLLHSGGLIGFAVVLLLIAAVIEVTISPLISIS